MQNICGVSQEAVQLAEVVRSKSDVKASPNPENFNWSLVGVGMLS